jgi:hypothetical protein
MRNVVAAEYLTVDGVMQDPGGVGEIEHGGWSNPWPARLPCQQNAIHPIRIPDRLWQYLFAPCRHWPAIGSLQKPPSDCRPSTGDHASWRADGCSGMALAQVAESGVERLTFYRCSERRSVATLHIGAGPSSTARSREATESRLPHKRHSAWH